MNAPRIASTLALLASLTGCGTLFSARATVTAQGASAHLNTDARVVAAATGIAALAAGLRAAGSVDSHAVVPAGVHAPTSATNPTDASGGQNTSTSGSLATASATPSSDARNNVQMGRVGSAVSLPTSSHVALSTQAMGALDELLRVAPAGSDDALRIAAAVEVTLRDAERAGPAFYNVPIRGRSIVLVVDVSYSMSESDPRAVDLSIAPGLTPTKLDVARAELVKVLGSLPPDVAVNIVAFSSNVTCLWQNPRTLDQATLSEAIRWVGALQPRDETEPVAAIEAAASMQPEQIVLLSDGRPTDRDTIARALLGLAEGVSSRMRLDVVGIGPDQDRTFLAALAARGRGELRLR